MMKKSHIPFKDVESHIPFKGVDYPLPFSSFDLRLQPILKIVHIHTHAWMVDDDTYVCKNCDCKYGSHPSEWPCGYPVPRSSAGWHQYIVAKSKFPDLKLENSSTFIDLIS